MKKRGMAQETINVIIAVIFILVIGSVITLGRDMVSEEKKIKNCQWSFLMNSKLRGREILGIETGEKIPINCPKDTITIGLRELEKSSRMTRENALKDILAEHIIKCREKTSYPGVGPLKPFDVDHLKSEEKFCLYCYKIEFKDDLRKEIPKLGGFLWYLNSKKTDEGESVLELLTGIKKLTREDYEKIKKQGFVDEINTSHDYSVLYAITKKGGLKQTGTTAVGAVGAGAVGCKIGALTTVIPGIGLGTFAIICGGSLAVGAVTGYHFGNSFIDDKTTYSFIKEEEINKMACNPLYQ